MLKDTSVSIRDTACWAIGRMCELHAEAVEDQLSQVINSLLISLDDTPEVVNHSCFALSSLADLGDKSMQNNILNPYLVPVMKKLLQCAYRKDAFESEINLMNCAVAALSDWVDASDNQSNH